ncbi:hypothetical protein I5677_06750 [Mobilitalea sibirica]|uniref:SCP domain-containing protein n=1 Tax=Mobilitalea sibirica TaxID=1462919 RepID=A0A8J7HC25_9FIRM|nr:hypothetical protein [Mobilitalea sibirica]
MFKNIDLSNCETTQDVVNELQKNGYTNITNKNIQNIDSLEDILATLENKINNQKSAAKTPAPTKAPSYTEPKAPNKVDTKIPSNTGTKTPTNTNANTGLSAYANQVLQLVNQERAKAGLSAFTTTPALTNAANKRAQEIVQSFSHTRPNGTSFSTALKEYGVSYRTSGENIAWGQKSAQEVVTGWMNSPGHRANILNGNFNKIGIGVYQSNGRLYWTQLFTN